MTGLIFDIQRFSLHDGPGIRTTIFFKGCSLRCFWCHNPESIRPQPEIQSLPDKCIGCGECLAACPAGARVLRDGTGMYDRAQCLVCGACVEVCFAGATILIGKTVTVEEVMADIRADRLFYETSGGGVTLSGGEPVLQSAFAQAILAACHAEGIHTAVETAGNYPWEKLAPLLPYLDLVLMDLKHLDPAAHRAATGVSNALILDNARRLAQTTIPLLLRMPIVPTVNDTEEAVGEVATFVRDLIALRAQTHPSPAPIRLELLAFHRLAADKYRSLGLDYRASQLTPLSAERMAELQAVARLDDAVSR